MKRRAKKMKSKKSCKTSGKVRTTKKTKYLSASEIKTYYQKILSAERLSGSTSVKGRDLTQESLSDLGRIIPSSPFRRMQAKAQVFSLADNAIARTRLTHSLEVAQFGRTLATYIFQDLLNSKEIDDSLLFPFVSAVENACLLHDIGNPPFGHFGEFSIRAWFSKKEIKQTLHKSWRLNSRALKKYYPAFANFDGNAQGFRIITRLSSHKDQFGLNLTCTLNSAYLKYLDSTGSNKMPFSKKVGFFEVDRERIQYAWNKMGFATPKRHPLTFIMEASDDIAYCVSDLEDGLEKGLFSFVDLKSFLTKTVEHDPIAKPLLAEALAQNSYQTPADRFVAFKIFLIRNFIDYAQKRYAILHNEILDGRVDVSLIDKDQGVGFLLASLKGFAKHQLFNHKEAYDLELCSNAVIQGLLNHFLLIFTMSSKEFGRLDSEAKLPPKYGELELEKRLYWLLPKKSVRAYKVQLKERRHPEFILRAHLIIDFISGMTDNFALELFQLLNGIEAKVRK